MTTTEEIVQKLDHIQSDLHFIKKHLTDVDVVLTDDDVEALQTAEKDFKEGRTKRLV